MKKEPIVSRSLIKEFNPSHSIPAKLRIGWEELMGVPINPAHYIGLSAVELDGADTTFDALLLHALLLQASQQFESETRSKITDDFKENNYQSDSRFRQPQYEGDIKQIKESCVPKKHKLDLRLQVPMELGDLPLEADIIKMIAIENNYWLQGFVVEARKGNRERYSPDSLHQICCGL